MTLFVKMIFKRNYMKKILLNIFVFAFLFSCESLLAQNNEMFRTKRELVRVWRKHNRNKDAYNPYLKKKPKDKPSAKINKSNKREERRQKRDFKKQLKRSKKGLGK
jgi:hypothetical protein